MREVDLVMKGTIDSLRYVSESLEDNIVSTLLEPLSKHHYGTYIHSVHVAFIAVQIGIQCNLPEKDLKTLSLGSVLHDVGKTEIPTSLLDKKGTLTDDEFNIIKTHPEKGYHILKSANFDDEVCRIALTHHRKLNNTGYPMENDDENANRLLNTSLDNLTQIVQVADMFEAIVTTRAYKKKYDIRKAIQLLENDVNSGVLEFQYVSILSNLSLNNQLLLQTI